MTTNDEDTRWTTINLDDVDDFVEEEEAEVEVENTEEDADEEEKAVDKAKKDRPSRAQERIKQLVAKQKELEAKHLSDMEEAKRKIKELEESTTSKTKQAVESQKTLITSNISAVKDSLRRAKEEGDIEKELELIEKLHDLQVDKRILDAQAAKAAPVVAKEEVTQDKRVVSAPKVDVPDEMRFWIEDNPWVMKPESREDRRKLNAVRKISNELEQDGYAADESEFYDELDARLKKLFDNEGEDDVEYRKDKAATSSKDEKPRNKAAVAGSARTPAGRKGSVQLSPSERQIASSLNLSPEQYAMRKKKREESGGGWTSI